MYVLYTDNEMALSEKTRLFEEYMEPLLQLLEQTVSTDNIATRLPEIEQYLKVCRWPFRKLEYSFALDVLLEHLRPDSIFLDAGSGVTPFAHILAGRGVHSYACDGNARLIDELRLFDPDHVYGSQVTYAAQDLTATSYPDAMFDAITCISVLEHIPAPYDQQAIHELLRILKPGGVLILTVDYTPPVSSKHAARIRYYARRAALLARKGDFSEIGRGITRKFKAQQSVRKGIARQPRSANQCFEVAHLEQDILPLLQGKEIASRMHFTTDLRSVSLSDARNLWDIEVGLYDLQGQRDVLPAALIFRKESIARHTLAR